MREGSVSPSLRNKMEDLFGRENVSLRTADPFVLTVAPENEDRTRELLAYCIESDLKIYTSAIGAVCQPGIHLDLGKLDRVFAVDPENLFATIGPGVTFDRLGGELGASREPMKLAYPVAATSRSLLRCYLDGAISPLHVSLLGRSSLVTNAHFLLASGDLYKTGSHLISEEDHWREEDYGPGLSYLFFSSRDTLGICIRAAVFLHPVQPERRVRVWDLPDKPRAAALLAEGARRQLWTEAFAVNETFLTRALSFSPATDCPWTVVASIEGSRDLVAALEQQATNIAQELDAQEAKENGFRSLLDRPWFLDERRSRRGWLAELPFFVHPSRVDALDELAREGAEELGELLIPLKGGRSFYCEYDFFTPPAMTMSPEARFHKLSRSTAAHEVAPGRPSWQVGFDLGLLSPSFRRVVIEIKKKIDPLSVFNPHLWRSADGEMRE